jgi:hypothetical protein
MKVPGFETIRLDAIGSVASIPAEFLRRKARRPGAGISTRIAALIALRIAQPIRLASSNAFNVPRNTRSRWLLIRFVVNRDDIVQRTR